MPNIKLTNRVAYKSYWKGIAESHVDIDGFKYGDKDVIKTDNRSDMPERVLWAMPYERAKYGDKQSDNVNKYKTAKVAYLKSPASESFTDEDTCFDECEEVLEQLMAKVLDDKRGKEIAGVWTMIATDVNSWSTASVEMTIGSTRYIGCELEIVFMDNTHLAIDATKWK